MSEEYEFFLDFKVHNLTLSKLSTELKFQMEKFYRDYETTDYEITDYKIEYESELYNAELRKTLAHQYLDIQRQIEAEENRILETYRGSK